MPKLPEAIRKDHVRLTFIVNGESCDFSVHKNCSLKAAAQTALRETKNTGRPLPEEWEVRSQGGVLMDQSLRMGQTTVRYMFLTLRVGAGGHVHRPWYLKPGTYAGQAES